MLFLNSTIHLKGTSCGKKGKKLARIKKLKSRKKNKLLGSKLDLCDGQLAATQRLQEIGFILSPTDPNTDKDGNCFMHAILDQLKYDPIWKKAKLSVMQLQERVTASLTNLMYSSDFQKIYLVMDIMLITTLLSCAHSF